MSDRLKLVFAGTPDFAVPSLAALINSGHDVCAVFTQPDRPKGRGRHLTASPIKTLAQQHRIPVYQPEQINTATVTTLEQYQADLMIVIAYGLLLPAAMLSVPRLGCFNVHASLLPRWRGAAPIQRAIAAGDQQTGVTIMQMDAGLDTGAIVLQQSCPISAEETSISLHDKLAVLGQQALVESLTKITTEPLTPTAQDNALACYAHKLNKTEAIINWQQNAAVIAAKIRAFQPWPGVSTQFADMTLKLWQAHAVSDHSDYQPGTLLALTPQTMDIACGSGILRVSKLQCPNRRPVTAGDFINAYRQQLIPQHTCFS